MQRFATMRHMALRRSWVLPGEPVPVRLMNTIWADRTGVHDDLSKPADLGAWLRSTYAAERPPMVTRRQFAAARQLRDALRRIAAFVTADTRDAAASAIGDVDEAIEIVNRAAAAGPTVPRLTRDGGLLHQTSAADGPTVVTALGAIAAAAIELFARAGATPLRACQAPGCVLYFVKDHPRREWCSNTCGNRARASRHYYKHRSDTARRTAP
jgi:predicted RNA-binding Zn ribbon-like protein